MRLERARNCICERCDDLISAFHKNRARLLSAEKSWQSAQSENCVDEDTDQNWIRHFEFAKEQAKQARVLQSVE